MLFHLALNSQALEALAIIPLFFSIAGLAPLLALNFYQIGKAQSHFCMAAAALDVPRVAPTCRAPAE